MASPIALTRRGLLNLPLLLLAASYVGAQPARMGPGAGPWKTASPESRGLNSTRLAAAAAEAAEAVPQRHCVLVVKDGAIVHEQSRHQKQTDHLQSLSHHQHGGSVAL